ncbi:FlaG/FlaF family flagellin (archaellin) [Methanomicrobium sp. W14]|uniref:type IV pilin N-terminal domain-containing protein n=1 Tax=Methanomicrobium sp. W14 TaxID=2817839 RepID=UPI001AEBA450|nr:type IV pilin N-terminal domain-containing protein [Methanomicrobium sp. W14]MBP2134046.1 FlaG/FlaF family flagellin (archaellin) [Methanomicrobium sp. W14]
MKTNDTAVSPVVGVMMMLVVTIIIAAVVSAFAGSSMNSQQKASQATIQGTFSIGSGMEITHMGGDALATNDLVFTVRNSPVFGPNLEQVTAQTLDKTTIYDGRGRPLDYGDGSTNATSFKSGDTLYINASSIKCDLLQPIVVPDDYTSKHGSDGYTYSGEKQERWALCFKNNDNIGNTFYLDVSDKSGNLICRSEVTITA